MFALQNAKHNIYIINAFKSTNVAARHSSWHFDVGSFLSSLFSLERECHCSRSKHASPFSRSLRFRPSREKSLFARVPANKGIDRKSYKQKIITSSSTSSTKIESLSASGRYSRNGATIPFALIYVVIFLFIAVIIAIVILQPATLRPEPLDGGQSRRSPQLSRSPAPESECAISQMIHLNYVCKCFLCVSRSVRISK